MAYQPNADEKSMGMISHLLCIFTGWIGPLIIFLTKAEKSPYIKLHSKQALFWGVAITVLSIIAQIVMRIFWPLGLVLLLAIGALHLVFTIQGTMKVKKGEKFLYPILAEKFCGPEIAAVYGDGATAAAAPPPPPAAPSA
jgi:uncharacterized protein